MSTATKLVGSKNETEDFVANLIIRGEVFDTDLVEFGGRGELGIKFYSPDPRKFLDKLPLGHGSKLADLYTLSFGDILDYLEELGKQLNLDTNKHLQKALKGSFLTAPTTPPIVEHTYRSLPYCFTREMVTEVAEVQVGIEYLENWVPRKLSDGRMAEIRAFGSRQLHIVAGNAPTLSALTIVRNAITRSDSIIKSPSNDPFTAWAIAQTMCEMAPDHPLTKHISVAYWKGGDEEFERQLYQPHNIEKIIAWGGFASVKHVTRYIQPGLELISLDPKNSISILGEETFESDETMREAAGLLAVDFGSMNQCGCVNSRKAYVQCGTDDEGLEKLKKLGDYTYQAMLRLPGHLSTRPKEVDRELKANVDALRMQDDWYDVIGNEEDEGGVICSLLPEPVSFAPYLGNRIINMIPIDNIDEVYPECDAYTQTVGIYPESLKDDVKNKLPLFGAQRIVSLGYAVSGNVALPQDSIEPIRRSCKWIVNEISWPGVASPTSPYFMPKEE